MAERTSVTQVTQLGVEATATPGTAVAASKRLQAISIDLDVAADFSEFRPEGNKYNTLVDPTREWSEGDLDGHVAYNEVQYMLAGILGNPTVVQIMDSAIPTGGYRYTYAPSSTVEDVLRTFTVERGSAYRAQRSTFVAITDLGLHFASDGVTLDGGVMGRAIADAITLTPGATETPAIPVLPGQVDVYLDTTSAALGTTKLARLKSADFGLGGRVTPQYFLDSAQAGTFTTMVETPPDASIDLAVEADAQGMGVLTQLRAGATRFLRIKCTGPVIYTGGVTVRHSLTIDAAVKVSDAGGMDDDDGLQVQSWTMGLVHDGTWGKAMTAEVITNLAAL